MRHY